MGLQIEMPDGTVIKVEGTALVPDPAVKALWSTAEQNQLPDSSFLYVEAGGTKDADGKTTPRSLRHFPVKDADGKVDLPHLRNALARIPQSSLPKAVKDRCSAKAERMLATATAKKGADAFTIPSRTIVVKDAVAGSKLHLVMNVALEPCTAAATKDTQGDFYTEADIERGFNTFCRKQGVGAYHDNPDVRGIELRDNFLVRWGDIEIEGQKVLKGSWVMSMQIDEEANPEVWALVQKGELGAFSIEGSGRRTPVAPPAAT